MESETSMIIRDLNICLYNKDHKMKKNKIIKHELTCPDRSYYLNNEAVSCPYNIYHRVLKSDLDNHVKLCNEKPKYNDFRKGVINDISNYLNKTSKHINNKFDNGNLCNKKDKNLKNNKKNKNSIKNIFDIIDNNDNTDNFT